MLGVSSYPQDYVDACRARVEAQVAAYDAIAGALRSAGDGAAQALDAFEPVFFNNLVLTLDSSFMHRLRGKELKDGNPLNEVRVLCGSLHAGGVFTPDATIKLTPEGSVLGHAAGDEIALREEDFVRLAEAFFAEIEKKFV